MESGFQRFVCPIDCRPNIKDKMVQELHQLSAGFGVKLTTEESKSKWLDEILKKHFSSRLLELLAGYFELVSEVSCSGKPPATYRKREHIESFSFCPECDDRFMCLYIFKELFPIFRPHITSTRNTILNKIFKESIEEIRCILDENFNAKGNEAGWPYIAGHRKEEEIDAYVTASLVNKLTEWRNHQNIIGLRNDFWKDQKNIDSCIQAISRLQETKSRIDTVMEERTGEKVDIKGSWRECYEGRNTVHRVRTAARIVTYLRQLGIDPQRAVIREAKGFIERAFENGKRPYCVDLTCFKDSPLALLSDIAGTIAALEMDMHLEKDCKDKNMLGRVIWLLDQQRSDGALPILTRDLLDKHKGTNRIRPPLNQPNGHEQYNVSLTNTVDAIRVLIPYLGRYLSD